jgi:5-methyltetrahydropteroyltriglutamate--homocysteine methyltransferase
MAASNDIPPFRADHVGSMIRPAALIAARQDFDAGKLGGDRLRELEDAAIGDVVAMQERAGLDCITDGEFRRHNWRDGFFESVDGFSETKVESSFIFTDYSGERRHGMPIPVVTGRLQRRKPIVADDFAHTKTVTGRTVKATLPSPTVNHFFSGDKSLENSPYADADAFFADVVAIYHQEIADLAALGCTYLQIDEVPIAVLCDPTNQEIVRARGEDPQMMIDRYIGVINDVARAAPDGMRVAVHLCRGNQGLGQASGGYEPVAERLFQGLEVDGFLLEYDTERAGDFAPLRFLPKGKIAALGLISTKLPELEPADELKRRVDEASRYADIERLALCPQCGFASSFLTDRFTAADQERKLAHLVKVAGEIWG